MTDYTPVLKALYRTILTAFAARAMAILEPDTRLVTNWHHEAIAYQLERCLHGEVKRLIINQPPKTLKTHLITICHVARLLALDPGRRIAIVCYDEDLASTQLRKIGQIMRSPWYRCLAPATRIRKDTETLIETTAGGEVKALSVQGGITGHGFDVIILDDPMKASLAYSENERRNLENIFATAIANRWRDPSKGVLICVMQRLHVDDFTAYLLRTLPGAVHLSIPAVAAADTTFRIGKGTTYRYREGALLEPDRLNHDVLAEMALQQGHANYSAQYLQAPTATGGRIIEASWLRDLTHVREPDYTIVSIDPAFTKDGGNYSAALVAGLVGDDVELHHGEQVQLDYPRLVRWIRDLDKRWKPDLIVIETIGAGKGLPDYLSGFGIDHVGRLDGHSGFGKVERMEMASPKIEAGRVCLPKSEEWAQAFLQILSEFPYGPSDDWPDALSQLIVYRDRIRAEARRHRERRLPPEPPPSRDPLPRGMHYQRWVMTW